MSKLITILTIALITGCVSNARVETLEKRLAASEERNRRLSASQSRGQRPSEQAPGDQQAQNRPAIGRSEIVQSVQTGTMIARRRHGLYMGTTGALPRQTTMGPKIQLVNHVCDKGSRDMWSHCQDVDRNGAPDYDTWLAFEIDGLRVVCDASLTHPDTRETLLAPGQTCFVELGRNSIVHLTTKAYRNFGTPVAIMLDALPDASVTKTVDIGVLTNTGLYEVDEGRFW